MHRDFRKKSLPPLADGGGQSWAASSPVRRVPHRRASMSDAGGSRPSTTAGVVNPRRQHHRPSTSHSSVVQDPAVRDEPEEENDPAGGPDEVGQLREEVRRLQNALLDKIRGTSKFVSGGQFRGHRVERVAMEEKCTVCFSLKTALKKVKSECRELRDAADDAQSQLAESMGRTNLALTAERNRADETLRNLQADLTRTRREAEERRTAMEALHAEVDQLRRAQSQSELDHEAVARREREVARASMQREIDDLRAELDGSKHLQAKLAVLETQLRDMTSRRDAQAGLVEAAEAHSADLAQQLAAQQAQAAERAALAKERIEALIAERAQLKEEMERVRNDAANASDASREAAQLRLELAREKESSAAVQKQLREQVAELQRSVQDEKARYAKLEREHHECSDLRANLDHSRAQVASLRTQLDQANRAALASRGDADGVQKRLKTEAGKLAAAERLAEELRSQLSAAHKRLSSVGEDVERLQEEVASLEAELRDTNEAFADQARELTALRKERDQLRNELNVQAAKAEDDALNAKKRLAALQAERDRLFDELHEKQGALDELDEKAQRAQQMQTQALETAMQSLVRLCVVAPTVNVHLGDQSMMCKAPLPTATIRSLVEEEILPRFTNIFLQAEEGAGPGDTTLDSWLEGLLAEMQTSIERHLRHVFQDPALQTRPTSRQASRPSSRGGTSGGARRASMPSLGL